MWKYIVLHHSLTADGKVVDTQAIRRYHTSYRIDGYIVSGVEFYRRQQRGEGKRFELPWTDIGYHFLVENINGQWEVLFGRPLTRSGAHCRGRMNRDGIGVCFVGNYDLKIPETKMIDVGIDRLIVPLCKIYKLDPDHIVGHRQYSKKTCPGKKFNLDDFCKKVDLRL